MFRQQIARRFHALASSTHFNITPEIKHAIANKGPVVALESTIISHGKIQKEKNE